MATESCVPWSTRESPKCSNVRPKFINVYPGLPQNGCFAQSYGALPYLTDSIEFQDAKTGGEGVKVWDRMKEHLSVRIAGLALYRSISIEFMQTVGPLYSGVSVLGMSLVGCPYL